ncbi:hypothetical protein QTP88_010942 [Uroleucon formosanum]
MAVDLFGCSQLLQENLQQFLYQKRLDQSDDGTQLLLFRVILYSGSASTVSLSLVSLYHLKITLNYNEPIFHYTLRHSLAHHQNDVLQFFFFLLETYLATGMAFRQLALSFRISKSTVSTIVIEVCKAIWKNLKEKHLPTPTIEQLKNIEKKFYEKWNYPNCIGSIDGKHIRVRCPKNSGSMFFNYKQYYSIVLMAIADANYKFIMVDVGGYGKNSDGGILCASNIYQCPENEILKIPSEKKFPNSNVIAPHVFIGDEAFPLRSYLMRPFPRHQLQDADKMYYNYRHARARMTIECAFGIASSKFRILLKAIETKIENVDHIVKSICILHNIIIDLEKNVTDTEYAASCREFDTSAIARRRSSRANNRATQTAINIRNKFLNFFMENKI